MRHFLIRNLGPPAPLPCGVLATAATRALVRGTRTTKRLAASHAPAVARAVDPAAIASEADAYLSVTVGAVEEAIFLVDHQRDAPPNVSGHERGTGRCCECGHRFDHRDPLEGPGAYPGLRLCPLA
jgi:hypothetical protein